MSNLKSKCHGTGVLVEVTPKYNRCGDMVAMKREGFTCTKCGKPCEIKENKPQDTALYASLRR